MNIDKSMLSFKYKGTVSEIIFAIEDEFNGDGFKNVTFSNHKKFSMAHSLYSPIKFYLDLKDKKYYCNIGNALQAIKFYHLAHEYYKSNKDSCDVYEFLYSYDFNFIVKKNNIYQCTIENPDKTLMEIMDVRDYFLNIGIDVDIWSDVNELILDDQNKTIKCNCEGRINLGDILSQLLNIKNNFCVYFK